MVALPDPLQNPVALALLTVAILALLQYQRTLSWREYRTLHGLKVMLAPIVDRRTTLFVLSRKGYRDGPEFLATRDAPVAAVWRRLVAEGASPHLINSVKVRPTPDGTRQYSAGHVVWTHRNGTQTEVYLFENPDGTTDVYAHHETGVANPDGHLTDGQTDGDPRDVVRMALGMGVKREESDAGEDAGKPSLTSFGSNETMRS
jgi:hypothetical protein